MVRRCRGTKRFSTRSGLKRFRFTPRVPEDEKELHVSDQVLRGAVRAWPAATNLLVHQHSACLTPTRCPCRRLLPAYRATGTTGKLRGGCGNFHPLVPGVAFGSLLAHGRSPTRAASGTRSTPGTPPAPRRSPRSCCLGAPVRLLLMLLLLPFTAFVLNVFDFTLRSDVLRWGDDFHQQKLSVVFRVVFTRLLGAPGQKTVDKKQKD